MKPIICSSLVIFFLYSCTKAPVAAIAPVITVPASLPLADTSLIGDTTVFYDAEFNGIRELSILPLGPCNLWQGKWLTFPFDFSLHTASYDCNFSIGDTLTSTRLEVKIRVNDFSAADTSFTLRYQKTVTGFSPNSFGYAQDLSNTFSVIVSRYDANKTLWATNLGTAGQTGSSFKITRGNGIPNGIYFRCSFNCTLYDGTGKTMTIKNGRMGYLLWL
jgi:hypothetical protein